MNLPEINPTSILDIGANVGGYSALCKLKWPHAYIMLIEGNPACRPALIDLGLPFEIALLSDQEKQVTFYQRGLSETSTGDSLYKEDTHWYETPVESERRTTTLDRIADGKHFDFLKLDVQGAELDVLKGGSLTVSKAKWIQLEVPAEGVVYNIGAPSHEEVMAYMDSIGFEPREVLEDIVHPIGRHLVQQDILFERCR